MHAVMKVPAVVGMHSLIGTRGKFPLSWGNYFALSEPEVYVLNFWAENLEEAVKRFLKDGLVQIRLYKFEVSGVERQVCIIDDPRIPTDWYYNQLCFTGNGSRLTAEVAKEIYDYLGDPNNQYEQFSDPEMYYARQGGVMHQNGGSIHFKVGVNAEDIVAKLLEKRKQEQTIAD